MFEYGSFMYWYYACFHGGCTRTSQAGLTLACKPTVAASAGVCYYEGCRVYRLLLNDPVPGTNIYSSVPDLHSFVTYINWPLGVCTETQFPWDHTRPKVPQALPSSKVMPLVHWCVWWGWGGGGGSNCPVKGFPTQQVFTPCTLPPQGVSGPSQPQ